MLESILCIIIVIEVLNFFIIKNKNKVKETTVHEHENVVGSVRYDLIGYGVDCCTNKINNTSEKILNLNVFIYLYKFNKNMIIYKLYTQIKKYLTFKDEKYKIYILALILLFVCYILGYFKIDDIIKLLKN